MRMPLLRNLKAILIAASVLLAAPGAAWAGEAAAWAALREGGHVAVVRHASAPGTGDPPGFRLADCATQRNLSPAGRHEAKAIGDAFRKHAVRVAGVYSSQWCRCLETARLMGLGEVTPFPPLNSFFEAPEREPAQMAALRSWLAEQPLDGTVVLVTHQVVITSLTGIFPAAGQIVVARTADDGSLDVVGRIPPPVGQAAGR